MCFSNEKKNKKLDFGDTNTTSFYEYQYQRIKNRFFYLAEL